MLRDYFREQYLTLHNGSKREEAPFFVEQFIDRRVALFLEETEQRLAAIRELEFEIETMRGGGAVDSPAPALKLALRKLEDELSDLRSSLAPIFLELKGKSRFRPELDPASGFETEFEFLHRRIDEAERQIREYLFSPGATVSVGTLQGGDMLVFLHEAAQMAKTLSREF